MGVVDRKPVGALQACGNEGRLLSGGWRIGPRLPCGLYFPVVPGLTCTSGSMDKLGRIWCPYGVP